LLRHPEVSIGFIMLGLLALLLDGGQAFRFLVSCSSRLSGFAAGDETEAGNEANDVKMLHKYSFEVTSETEPVWHM
jgi:hypothetical protein